MKRIVFLGDALEVLRDFPEGAQRGGRAIAQNPARAGAKRLEADEHDRPGVREIRIRDAAGAFRVIYVANVDDAVFVLHAFQKKAQRTAKKDLDLALARFKQI